MSPLVACALGCGILIACKLNNATGTVYFQQSEVQQEVNPHLSIPRPLFISRILVLLCCRVDCWNEYPDAASGHSYYWNFVSDVRQWTRPEGMGRPLPTGDPPSPPLHTSTSATATAATTATTGGGGGGVDTPSKAPSTPLPFSFASLSIGDSRTASPSGAASAGAGAIATESPLVRVANQLLDLTAVEGTTMKLVGDFTTHEEVEDDTLIYSNYRGYLKKKGGGTSLFGRRNWKERYCSLSRGLMGYYDSARDYEAGKEPLKGNFLSVRLFKVDP